MVASPFSIEDKVAIVTGGGVGIGKSIALEFARAGADVVIASRKLENLEPVTAEITKLGRRSFCVAVDVRQEDQVKALVERTVKEMGRLDVMVNNAGASFRAKVEDISANGWNTVVGINLNGTFFGCKWAGKQMLRSARRRRHHQHLVDRGRLRLDHDVALRRLQGRGDQLHPRARHGLGPARACG